MISTQVLAILRHQYEYDVGLEGVRNYASINFCSSGYLHSKAGAAIL
jgi:hypothetical protein